jgi:hypothetical protein
MAMVSGLGGGIIRDILLGALPPATFSDWRYLAVAAGGGLAAFALSRPLTKLSTAITVLDAAGLGLFAVTGASKSLALGLAPAPAVILGVITGSAAGRYATHSSDGYRPCSGAGCTPSRPCSPRESRSRRSGHRPTGRPPRWLPRSPASPSGCSASATTSTPRRHREESEVLHRNWRLERKELSAARINAARSRAEATSPHDSVPRRGPRGGSAASTRRHPDLRLRPRADCRAAGGDAAAARRIPRRPARRIGHRADRRTPGGSGDQLPRPETKLRANTCDAGRGDGLVDGVVGVHLLDEEVPESDRADDSPNVADDGPRRLPLATLTRTNTSIDSPSGC